MSMSHYNYCSQKTAWVKHNPALAAMQITVPRQNQVWSLKLSGSCQYTGAVNLVTMIDPKIDINDKNVPLFHFVWVKLLHVGKDL
jgi:hypothetical protein